VNRRAAKIRPATARLTLAILAASPLAAAPSLPLQDGERLTYRVSWAVVPGAGEIRIEGRRDESEGRPRLIVSTTTATRRLARMLMPFDADAKSIYDFETGRLLTFREHSEQGEKVGHYRLDFDYATRQVTYARTAPKPADEVLTLPEGDPSDLILGLLQTRSWDLKPGEQRDALVIYAHDFYEITIHAMRQEEVRTSLGRFTTTLLEPRMEKTAPKGMFKRGSVVRVWIAQDPHRLPVKFEVEFKIGTGTSVLESYTPPTGAKAAESKSTPAPAHAKNPGP
jgi:hypothetical protein